MENTKNVVNNENTNKELVTIKYFDRIHHQWIDLEVTKEVANFMNSDSKKQKRKQAEYDFYNEDYDEEYDDKKKKNNIYIADESQNPEKVFFKDDEVVDKMEVNEQKKIIIENNTRNLSEKQREVVELELYENLTQSKIAEKLGISQQAVQQREKLAVKGILKQISETK